MTNKDDFGYWGKSVAIIKSKNLSVTLSYQVSFLVKYGVGTWATSGAGSTGGTSRRNIFNGGRKERAFSNKVTSIKTRYS